MLSDRSEDLLKAIYEMQHELGHERVTTSVLADKLNVTAAYVTGMLKKLAVSTPKFVEYQRYRGVSLTDDGKQVALQLIRRHRLIESFLAQSLGYSWDEVHQEADTLEHAITEDLGERIAASLFDPETDPHGSPIPHKDGTVENREELPLSHVEIGEEVIVLRVSDHNPKLLRYLSELEVKPRTPLQVLERGRFDDLFHILNSQTGKSHHLSRFVADQVFVTPSDEA